MKKQHLLSILLFISVLLSTAQSGWTSKNIFEQKNFIENKGQFNNKQLPNKQTVLYAADIDGVTYYFTSQGYTISQLHREKNNEEEKEQEKEKHHFFRKKEKGREEEEKEFQYKTVEQFHELKWEGSNPNPTITADHQVNNYYSYSGDQNNEGKPMTIIAHGYTKLTYKNIYPNTDIVFEIPTDSAGIKYSIYLHPGADVEKIKMSFPDETVKLDNDNNLIINSAFGNITDHAPRSYIASTKTFIGSHFKIINKQVGFELVNAPPDQTTVIDPWTVTPHFGVGLHKAYDVDYDNQGNVYVYGGWGPYHLLKYDASGTLIWTYIDPFGGSFLYGDFAIDRSTNSIYLIEGLGGQVVKINSSAVTLTTFPGDPNFSEMWRIAFSRCTNQAVIAGGGAGSTTIGQTCLLDTNLTTLTPVKLVPTATTSHDMGMLALDNYGNSYEVTLSQSDGLLANQLVKLPLPALWPIAYNVNTNFTLNELTSNLYYAGSGFYSSPIGYNGLTTSNSTVYGYDSYVLKKWEGLTGSLLRSERINYPVGGDSSKIYWGGISADDCGNLFLADSNQVAQYDSALNLVKTYTMPGVIYDIVLSNQGQLYVCGSGFLSSLLPDTLSNCTFGLNITSTPKTCTTPGMAIVAITGGTSPYTITWNTTPVQNGATLIAPPGFYSVSVTDGSCKSQTITDTITILNSSSSNEISFHPANVFSPNADKKNDEFFPYVELANNSMTSEIQSYDLQVYDRWGINVFTTTDPSQGWDGVTKKNKNADEGTYYWILKIKTNCSDTEITETGFVQLVR